MRAETKAELTDRGDILWSVEVDRGIRLKRQTEETDCGVRQRRQTVKEDRGDRL